MSTAMMNAGAGNGRPMVRHTWARACVGVKEKGSDGVDEE